MSKAKYLVLGLLLTLFFIGCTNNKNVSNEKEV